MTTSVLVSEGIRKKEVQGKPEHWDDASCSGFHNPWSSWRNNATFKDMFQLMTQARKFPSVSKETSRLIALHIPNWGIAKNTEQAQNYKDKIKSTWLGHACFLIEMPSRSESGRRGARILFDPVFSDRCSPSQWVGPKRFTREFLAYNLSIGRTNNFLEPPCKLEEIPEIDAVVISHNHYDQYASKNPLDTHTISILSKRPRIPHFFAPLGNRSFFKAFDIPDDHVHIMDWWDVKRLKASFPTERNEPAQDVTVDITCTPAQHFTGRSLFDRFKTLWASWVVEEVRTEGPGVKVFFGGDTGYRSVPDGKNEDEMPVCPAFKEIGERFGGFDFAMIPIGAYMPRQFMSPIHCAPQDSVRLFKDIRAKKALGMHWGTWVLTAEDVLEPPKKLAEECRKIGIEEGAFSVCEIGETVFF
ncbi:hypothetical protein H0H92_003904 [Tricholoma furcatifolium]|nr:hypothetical protein H0H92_003904 [Tricholoma furcatifolium]